MSYQEWLEKNKNLLKCKPRTQRASFIDFLEGEFKGEPAINFKRGEVYFAKLTDSAKIRPFLIYQNDYLNQACFDDIYHSIVVLPLSGQMLKGDYRYLIKKRDNMSKDSEVVCNAIGIISTGKVLYSKGLVTKLSNEEMNEIDNIVKKVLGMQNGK